MMTEKNLNEWIEALRSDEYEQACGQLKKGGGYCCLGLYQEINNLSYDPCASMPDNRVTTSRLDNILAVLNDNSFEDLHPFSKDTYIKFSEENKLNIDFTKPHSFSDIADFLETNKKFICKN